MDFVFLGFMAAMAVAGLVVGKLAGKKLGKAEFDERQQLARGKAYKAGFYTLLVGLLAVYLIPIFTEWQPKDTALLLFAVICVGVTVFACVAVANDAYLGIRQNPRAMLLVLGIVVVGNLTAGFSVMESVGFADGLAVENSMNFIIAAMGLIILAALAIRLRMAARDEEWRHEEPEVKSGPGGDGAFPAGAGGAVRRFTADHRGHRTRRLQPHHQPVPADLPGVGQNTG